MKKIGISSVINKSLCVLIAFVMIFSLMPATAFADDAEVVEAETVVETTLETEEETTVEEEISEETLSEEEEGTDEIVTEGDTGSVEEESDDQTTETPTLKQKQGETESTEEDNDPDGQMNLLEETPSIIYETPEEVVPIYKEAILNREETLTFSIKFYPDENEDFWVQTVQLVGQINNLVQVHTGNPIEGDYLRYWGTPNVSSNSGFVCVPEGDHYINTIIVDFWYEITQAEENELTFAIDQLMEELDLDGKTDYEKVAAVYGYVTQHVEYGGNGHVNHPYGALIEGESVCNGISLLMYRLLLTAGIEARVVTGSMGSYDGSTWFHMWNIVRLGDYYYSVDATWDLNHDPADYEWFLLGKSFYVDRDQHVLHKLGGGYTEEFYNEHPLATLDYGDDALLIEEENTYDLSIEVEETKTVAFVPNNSGRYTLASSNANQYVCAEIVPYFTNETVKRDESNIGNDISYVYKLEKDHLYYVYVGLDDSTQSDTFSLSLTKNPIEERTIESVSCEELMFYYTGTGSTGICDQGSYMYYDVRPKDMTVSLDNGTVLTGTLDEILNELDDVYEIQPEYSFSGDDQSYESLWGVGVHNITLYFDGFTMNYQVEIAENPITAVSIDVVPYVYDDEYKETTNENTAGCIYHINIDNITVTTQTKTYQGDYDNVYQEICEDYSFDFEYIPVIKLKYYWGSQVGNHNCSVNLFGVETPFDMEIRYNPVNRITATDRTVTETDQYMAYETVLDENSQEQTVSYMAYPHEPYSVQVTFKDNKTYTGTADEVMTYLSENYDYHEEFQYDNKDSYNDRWDIGLHPVTISLRNAYASYNVIVGQMEYVPLELDTETVTSISGRQSAFFSYSIDAMQWVCGFYMDSYDGISAYLYDENMVLLTDNENRDPDKNQLISYYLEPNKTYYLKVKNNTDAAKEVGVTPHKVFQMSNSANNVNTVLYENQAVLKEEIYNGDTVSYMWYDWNPTVRLWISTLGNLNGTLEEISDRVYEAHGVELDYYVGCSDSYGTYQSYENQWTVGTTSAQGCLQLYNGGYYTYQLTINEGPIISMDISDVTCIEGYGTNETVTDDQGVEHTFMRYDAMPVRITAHTVDGDISGTPEEILGQIYQTYNVRLSTSLTGDDQDYLNPWGEGSHEMTFSIGNVSAEYSVNIESIAIVDSGTCGDDLTWTLDENGLLIISGTGAINANAFSLKMNIISVIIENGATSIGNASFSGCQNIIDITIPNSVTSIASYAFNNCSNLESITIPSGVTSIGYCTFAYCHNLKSISLSDSITYIDDLAFISCDSLENIILPSNLTTINGRAFADCTSLESLLIPANVSFIGNRAFNNCSNLDSIIVDGENLVFDSRGNCSAIIKTTTNELVIGSNNTVIPDGVTKINDYAFRGRGGLTDITIPDSVTSIGIAAFGGCSNLTSITIPESVTSIGDSAFGSCYSLANVTIPSGVTSLGDYAFSGCASLTNVVVPDSISSIGEATFATCTALTSITIPDTIVNIGKNAFTGCSSLTSIILPESVINIGDHAFDRSGLTSITIPKNVISIGGYAFEGCPLSDVVILGNITSIKGFTFYLCGYLTSIAIPDTVTTIENSAFDSCNNLTDVYYGGSRKTWDEINIDSGNTELIDATIHFTKASCLGYTITLDESISLNYYFDIPECMLDDNGAMVVISKNGETVSETLLSEVLPVTNGDITGYVFSCDLVTKEMADMVEAIFVDSEGNVSEPYEYSAKQYCEELIEMNEGESGDANLVALIKALMNYGAAAQEYFGYNTGNLANSSLSASDKLIGSISEGVLSQYATTWGTEDGVIDEISYYGVTLDLLADLNIKLYFQLPEGRSISDYTYTIAGNGDNQVELVTGVGRYGPYARISNIYSVDIDAEYTVYIFYNGQQIGWVHTSPFAYINSSLALSGLDEDLRELLCAMYYYNVCAKAYF